MKVLFLNACGSLEGDINHALLVLGHLPPEIVVLAASLPRGGVYEALCALPNVATVFPVEMGGSEQPPPNRRPGAAGEAPDFAGALRRILGWARRERVDMICSIDRTVSAYLAAIAATILRRPFVLIAAYPFYGHGKRLNRWVLRRATCIVSHSEYLTGHLRAFVPDPSRIATIPDPLEVARYRPDPSACAAQRAEWNIPADATVILLAGRVNQYKGHDDLVRAAHLVTENHPLAYFFFAGARTHRR